jgi:hypothetical protein
MQIKKSDKKFYIFERVALKVIAEISLSDDYIGESGARELMNKISRSYGMKVPDLKLTRKDSQYCYYRRLDHSIYYNSNWGFTTCVVIHEMAHAIVAHKRIYEDTHGPEFVRTWIDLICRMFEYDSKLFENLADQKGISYKQKNVVHCEYKPKYI